jgi:hypothetical protein
MARECLQEFGNGRGQGNEGCAGVEYHAGVIHLGSLLAERDGIKVNLPVGLAPQRKLDELARVVALVNAAKGGLGLLLLVGVAEVEGEDGLVEEALFKHVVEGRHDAVHADGVVAETHDAVEPAEGKGKTWLRSRLGEVLVLHLEVANLEDIVGHEAAQLAGSVADLKRGAVLLVCRRRRRVVLGVQVAGDRVALGRRHPEVGAARVEHDLECLRRRAEGDLGEVWTRVSSCWGPREQRTRSATYTEHSESC